MLSVSVPVVISPNILRDPAHYRSAYLGDSDPFGYLVEGCKKMGMVVIAGRIPMPFITMSMAHPEWIAVDAEGNHVGIGQTPMSG